MALDGKKILSIGAHPDDIELGCGATEALMVSRGYEITHLYVTSGGAGSQTIPPDQLVEIREKEAQAAAAVLGAKEVIFMRLPDGLTGYDRSAKIVLINHIRRVRPDIVFLHAASDTFPDHIVVRSLCLSALRGASGPWYHESSGVPWSPSTVLGYEVWNPIPEIQLGINVSDTFAKKIEALECYRSQIKDVSYIPFMEGLARYRGGTTMMGVHVEGFEVHRISQL
jgi:LmbE family N-acetylglucosaminyl deacetylase